jgi:DNA polymerase III epsilon subunit-like protein
MARSLVHLNGNLLCAVDTETTGLDPEVHDIVQIAVLPLDSEIRPLEGILPFNMHLKPKRPQNADPKALKINRLNLVELIERGMEPDRGADIFMEWFEKLNLGYNKRIAPLGHNYPFDRGFIHGWLGPKNYEFAFDYHVRDSVSAALFLNDRAAFHAEAAPYPKVNLKYLCSQLGVENQGAHDALQDCLATAECYRRMMQAYLPTVPAPLPLPAQ